MYIKLFHMRCRVYTHSKSDTCERISNSGKVCVIELVSDLFYWYLRSSLLTLTSRYVLCKMI